MASSSGYRSSRTNLRRRCWCDRPLIVDQQGTYVFVVADGRPRSSASSWVACRVRMRSWTMVSRVASMIVQGMESLRPGTAVMASPAPPSAGPDPRSPPSSSSARLATVIAIVTTIAGLLSLLVIPIAHDPDIVPLQVSVTTLYPGASAPVVN